LEEFRQAALRCLDNYRFLNRWGRDERFKPKRKKKEELPIQD